MHASRLTQPRLQILYQVDGGSHAKEFEVPELLGYRGSAPVRIGNGAADQVQLDVYGAVFESIWLYAQHVGHLDGETGKEMAKIADYVGEHWRDRDSGIWEVRSEATRFTQSKALCCVALDRACALAERDLIPDHCERWRTEARRRSRRFVAAEGWERQRWPWCRMRSRSARARARSRATQQSAFDCGEVRRLAAQLPDPGVAVAPVLADVVRDLRHLLARSSPSRWPTCCA